MIPNHARFIEAIKQKKKVTVRFYSKADNGVLDRICAPMSYGQGDESHDELNRYWLWDYEGNTGPHVLGLLPQQIVDLQVLGLSFSPEEFVRLPPRASVSRSPSPAAVASSPAPPG